MDKARPKITVRLSYDLLKIFISFLLNDIYHADVKCMTIISPFQLSPFTLICVGAFPFRKLDFMIENLRH